MCFVDLPPFLSSKRFPTRRPRNTSIILGPWPCPSAQGPSAFRYVCWEWSSDRAAARAHIMCFGQQIRLRRGKTRRHPYRRTHTDIPQLQYNIQYTREKSSPARARDAGRVRHEGINNHGWAAAAVQRARPGRAGGKPAPKRGVHCAPTTNAYTHQLTPSGLLTHNTRTHA